IKLPVRPLLEEQILALVKAQHHSAVELARLRVLREEDRIMDDQVGKLCDDHLHEALVVAVRGRSPPVHSEGAVRFFVERNDLRHGAAYPCAVSHPRRYLPPAMTTAFTTETKL